jgi:hypothetical protein
MVSKRLAAMAVAGVAVATAAGGAASSALNRPQSAAAARPLVPRGDFLVVGYSGHFRVLDARGRLVRRLRPRVEDYGSYAIALTPDRRSVFVQRAIGEAPALFRVNLATGRGSKFADAVNPAVSPGGTRIAYVSTVRKGGFYRKDALVVRSLQGNDVRSISLGTDDLAGQPTDVINWSPNGHHIVLDDNGLRVATLGSAGLELGPPIASGLGAPAFLDENTLVGLANCCTGNQRLVSIDLRSGRRKPFAVVPGPPETIRRLRDGVLLVVTASNKLMVVSHSHKRVIARRVIGADR